MISVDPTSETVGLVPEVKNSLIIITRFIQPAYFNRS